MTTEAWQTVQHEPIRNVALLYAAAGFRILPTHTVEFNTEADFWVCTCGRDCRSAGKHPRLDLVEHGAYSATTDPDVINAWPESGYNLGVGLEETLIAIDIDDPAIWAALTTNEEFTASHRFVADASRRGGHIYIRTTEPTRSSILKLAADDRHVGEIRAYGEYVVLPPSVHPEGLYLWISYTLFDIDTIEPYVGTGTTYAHALLADAGYPVVDTGASYEMPPGGGVDAVSDDEQIPFKIRKGSVLRQLLDGVRPVRDRSDTLYLIACECYRHAATQGIAVTPTLIAGIVRMADLHYRKFIDRPDGERRYYELAMRSQADVRSRMPQQEEPVATEGTPPPPRNINGITDLFTGEPAEPVADYTYDEDDGLTYNRGKTPKRICNFDPLIAEQRMIYQGEDDPSSYASEWTLRMTKEGETIDLTVSSAQYADPRLLVLAIRRACPSYWVIEDQTAGLLLSAIQHRSGVVPVRTVYATTGWLPDREVFVLPGFPAAVTPEGWDNAVVFESHSEATAELAVMAAPRTINEGANLSDVLRLIMASGPSRILSPLLTQIAAAPLLSVGYRDLAWMHLLGPTQSFKTSVAQTMLGLYGYAKSSRAQGITSFASDTDGMLRKWPHLYRDLPVLIDDYKSGSRSEAQIVNMVQSYGDARGRGRLNRSGHFSSADDPRGMIISTGEDIWENQRSALARTMIIQVDPASFTFAQVVALRDSAVRGDLAALGVAWVRWLAKRGRGALRAYLDAEPRRNRDLVARTTGLESQRIAQQTTALFTVSRLFAEFVKAAAPDIAEDWRRWAAIGWLAVFTDVQEQASESIRLSPLNQLLDMLRDGISGGRCYLAPRFGESGVMIGTPGSRCVGYVQDQSVYLTKALTYYWFLEEAARARREAGFSWNQITREIKERFGSVPSAEHVAGQQTTKMIRLPKVEVERDSLGPTVENRNNG